MRVAVVLSLSRILVLAEICHMLLITPMCRYSSSYMKMWFANSAAAS